MTRVLIADGQLSFCRRLRQMLERRRDIQVVGETSDAPTATQAIRELRPDILLIDLGLCRLFAPFGVDAGGPAPQRTIVTLATIDKSAIVEAFRFGAQGILLKTAGSAMWGKTIRRIMDGQYCFENGSVDVLLQAFRASFVMQTAFGQNEYGLTTRELEIVAEIAAGHSNRKVGERFAICERTVKHHLTNIFDKVGVSNRLGLALFAVNHNLVASESAARRLPADALDSAGQRHSGVAKAGTA